MATLTFYGATGQVTGSCYLLATRKGERILLDCGLFQGERETERQNEMPFPFDPAAIDAVVLSHAHLDHSGRLPRLARQGFKGRLFLTQGTHALLELMLKDAAYLHAKDIEWENKRRQRAGKKLLSPQYTLEDVEAILQLREAVEYNSLAEILPGVELEFLDAGHILGSSIVKLRLREKGADRTLVFSGDLGNSESPLLPDPQTVEHADVLLLESTYGDRDHKPLDATIAEFREILEQAGETGGNVIIPAFAVGRTQDLIYWLGRFQREGALPQQQIFLDSPMAISASKIYARHLQYFNRDDPEFLRIAVDGWRAWLSNLTFSESPEESMAINRLSGGAIIIAGSGMCDGGRVRHHLKNNLWRRNAHLVIAGFQAQGTLGRRIVDGAKKLKILGSEIHVAAQVHTLGALSAHADQGQLIQWAGRFREPKPRMYLVHGEKNASLSLQSHFHREGWRVKLPEVAEEVHV
ncbi:MAG: MBL fold metallo-hydrolase RNA specificity domain-containing protein [Gammaproteobacteria bacterium]